MHIPKSIVLSFSILSSLLFATASELQARGSEKSFVMRATEPVIVENTLLAPGNHVWKLMDSLSNRNIVQISDEKTNHIEAIIVAVPKYRDAVTAENKVEFWETPSGSPRAVRAWFYPGDNYGQEFPYSKKAVLSASLTPAPVLVQNQVAQVDRSPEKVAVASQPHPLKPQTIHHAAQAPEGSWAIITSGTPKAAKVAPSKKSAMHVAGIWETIKSLPLTATIAPLIGIIGLGFMLLFGMSYLKRKNGQSATL